MVGGGDDICAWCVGGDCPRVRPSTETHQLFSDLHAFVLGEKDGAKSSSKARGVYGREGGEVGYFAPLDLSSRSVVGTRVWMGRGTWLANLHVRCFPLGPVGACFVSVREIISDQTHSSSDSKPEATTVLLYLVGSLGRGW